MSGLRVLITNITLATRTGTELYVRDLATGLLDRGYTPIVYSPELGPLAGELRAAAIAVVDDLDALVTPPDVIHGHHNLPTMAALLRFPGVPAVFFCHDSRSWHDSPPSSSRIRRYIAVDLPCRDRLVQRHGIPEDRVRLLLNFVDLKRFSPRDPLPPRPARALVFSNNASERTHVGTVREACNRAGIALDVIGASAGKACARPEEVLGQYDLVFAKGRCALEAAAVGAAVILCDAAGTGPMATTGELDRLRHLNFGRRALLEPVHPEVIGREIARYDPKDAAEVSRRVRAAAGCEAAIGEIALLYQEILAEHLTARGMNGDGRWRAATHFRMLGWRFLRLGWQLDRRYGPMKYRVVLPATQRIKRLLRPQRADGGGSPSPAAGRRGS